MFLKQKFKSNISKIALFLLKNRKNRRELGGLAHTLHDEYMVISLSNECGMHLQYTVKCQRHRSCGMDFLVHTQNANFIYYYELYANCI